MSTQVITSPTLITPSPGTYAVIEEHDLPPFPDVRLLNFEDDEPVDSIYAEKQERLLTEPLYSSWSPGEGRTFLALANVGLFYENKNPGLSPDVMLSLDVPPVEDRQEWDNRSYFCWVIGKVPEVVIEFVSDRRGREDTTKMEKYRRIRIPYYVVYDPRLVLQAGVLRAFALNWAKYEETDPRFFPEVGIGLRLWQVEFEGEKSEWLRWCYPDGQVIPTGFERAEQEKQRTDQEKQRADEAEAKLRRLTERLKQLGETVD